MRHQGVAWLLEYRYRRYMLLRNWRSIVRSLYRIVRSRLPDARVYVFGSVVKGKFTAASDIDVLIVSERAPQSPRERVDLQLWIEDQLGVPPGLLDLHFARPGSEEYEWFTRVLRLDLVSVEEIGNGGEVPEG